MTDDISDEPALDPENLDEIEMHAADADASNLTMAAVAQTDPLEPLACTSADIFPPPKRVFQDGAQLFERGLVNLIIGSPGSGKTAFATLVALATATGLPLIGTGDPVTPGSVWFISGEDSRDELQRRVSACARHHNIAASAIGGRLFLNASLGEPIVQFSAANDFTKDRKLVQRIVQAIERNRIKLIILDSLTTIHSADENSNMAMERIMRSIATIAEKADCVVILLHHVGKLGGEQISAEKSRGASAIVAKARSVITVNPIDPSASMQKKKSKTERESYIKVRRAKANSAPGGRTGMIYKLVSVDLHNGLNGEPADHAQALESVDPPKPKLFTPAEIAEVVEYLRRQEDSKNPWRTHSLAKNWIGKPVAEFLKLDLTIDSDFLAVTDCIQDLIEDQVLIETRFDDSKGNSRPCCVLKEV